MRVLDIDIDFFLFKVAHSIKCNQIRLPNSEYITWDKHSVKLFLENQCGLSEKEKIKGRIVDQHDEVFFFWRELIRSGELIVPFELVHIDAHDDLYVTGFVYNKLINKNVIDRDKIENYKNEMNDGEEMDCGNYLLFALACRWIKSLKFIPNPKSCIDYIINNISEKGFIHICNDGNMEEPYVTYKVIEDFGEYIEENKFDYITVSRSLSFTPKKSDEFLGIFRKYIEKI